VNSPSPATAQSEPARPSISRHLNGDGICADTSHLWGRGLAVLGSFSPATYAGATLGRGGDRSRNPDVQGWSGPGRA
jgi:hypothetical protein